MEGMNLDGDVRCPTCKKLLAKRRADGAFEVKLGRRFQATIRDGDIMCTVCWCEVPCRPPPPAMRLTFGRT